MTSYELINYYETFISKVKSLEAYTEGLEKLILLINAEKEIMLKNIYANGINDNSSILDINITQRGKIITLMKRFAMDFDLLENQMNLIQIKSDIDNILSMPDAIKDDQIEKILNLLKDFNELTNIIYDYVRGRKNDTILSLINKASDTVSKYKNIIENHKNIKQFLSKTENKIELNESMGQLRFYFYDEHSELNDYIVNFETIKKIYEDYCNLMDVSTIDNPIQIVKIESGSLFEDFFGHKSVTEGISYTFKKIVDLIFKKFTFEGKMARNMEILEFLDKDVEVRKKYAELGIDINLDDEDNKKMHLMAIKSMRKLVAKNTRIKINDEEFRLQDNLKGRYIEESKKLLIDGPKDEVATDNV